MRKWVPNGALFLVARGVTQPGSAELPPPRPIWHFLRCKSDPWLHMANPAIASPRRSGLPHAQNLNEFAISALKR